MTKFATQLTAICLFCVASSCCMNAEAADFYNGLSEEEYFFLLDLGLANEADLYWLDPAPEVAPTKASTTTRVSKRDNEISGLNIGFARVLGLSGTDLGSTR